MIRIVGGTVFFFSVFLLIASSTGVTAGFAAPGETDEAGVLGTAQFTPTASEVIPAGKEPQAGDVWVEDSTLMEFVWIPGGCFQMGSPEDEEGRKWDEGPVHEVCVDGFWMGRYEVTNAQYRLFASHHDSGEWRGHSLNWDDQPAVNVSWEDARAFARWMGEVHNGTVTFRLPTEAEWEYACRAGTQTARHWGEDPDEACGYANTHDRSMKEALDFFWPHHDCDDGYVLTAPVGRFRPNPFGLYDMLGNVYEWCRDRYMGDAYSRRERFNPVVEEGIQRVIRGGSFRDGPKQVRCAARDRNPENDRKALVGFRLVRNP